MFSFFRTRLLSDVYSLLADLIDWSDKLLLLKPNATKIQITEDDQYKTIAHDLLEAIKVRRNHIKKNSSRKNFFSSELHFTRM